MGTFAAYCSVMHLLSSDENVNRNMYQTLMVGGEVFCRLVFVGRVVWVAAILEKIKGIITSSL